MRPAVAERPLYASWLAVVGIALAAVGVIVLGVYPPLALGWLGQTVVMP